MLSHQHNYRMDHSQQNTMAPHENERKASLRPSLTSVAQTMDGDLSNLCIGQGEPDQRIVATSSHPQERCQQLENSLYPTVKELYESTDRHDTSVEDIFAQAERYRMSRMKESRMLQKESNVHSSRQSQSSSRPGAYPSTSQIEKPGLPAWVENAQQVREKVERHGFLSEVHSEATRREHPMPLPLSPALGQCNDTSYRGEESSAGSRSTKPSSRNSKTNNTYRGARPAPQPIEVEVAPGEFMPLRGSDETLEAIEMGYARIVTCFACSASLACVPDCELVICPDCRVISPICSSEQEDERKVAHHNDNPYGGWEDGNAYYHQTSPPPRGVGLGLKMR
jgi:hypothetical protein